MIRAVLILSLAVLASLPSCTQSPEDEQPDVPELGKMASFNPRVVVRRNKELVWQDAVPELALFPYDAVRTYPAAKARVELRNGSTLDINEDSLIILNPSALRGEGRGDRAEIQSGKLQGRTSSALWIKTREALLKIKPSGAGGAAQATVAVSEGGATSIELEEGDGSLIGEKTSPNEAAPEVPLEKHKPVRLTARGVAEAPSPTPVPLARPRGRGPDSLPDSRPPPHHKSESRDWASEGEKAKEREKAVTLVVSYPPNYSEVAESSIQLRGHVTRRGGEVRVNGQPAPIDDKLEFSVPVALAPGANTILIQLIREGGDSLYHRWTVIRKN